MRDCILRSIAKENTLNSHGQNRYYYREDIPKSAQPSIEVKFLHKGGSSTSLSEKTNEEESKLPEQNSTKESVTKTDFKNLPLPDFDVPGSFETSSKFFNKNIDTEAERHSNFDRSIDDISPKRGNSGKNSLQLAIRSKSVGIFEDCSTYDISCPDSSPELKSNEIFTNSLAGSSSNGVCTDQGNSAEINSSFSDSELTFSSSINNPNNSDEPTSLCDTFFTHFANEENGQMPKSQSADMDQVNNQNLASRNSSAPKEDDTKQSEQVVDAPGLREGGRRNSKKIRRRQRKNYCKEPVVYECPKCGVSYVIASKVANDGVCFHCDMWTSVDPEFMKREKLLTWNTCCIC